MVFRVVASYLLLFFVLQVQAQILDDSTRQIYGVNTSRYIYEEDLLNIDSSFRIVDTTVEEYHMIFSPFQERNFSQDLGNFGTPRMQAAFNAPEMIGRQFGFSAMDYYFYDPTKVRLFDTRSPYSQVNYFQGTRGQQAIEVAFARNIMPNWNFGCDIRRLTSKRQIGFPARNEKQVVGTSFQMNSRFYTKDKRYHVVGVYSMFEHRNQETGGVSPQPGYTLDSLFDAEKEFIVFTTPANSADRRAWAHLYQQYDFFRNGTLQVYGILDYQRRVMRYKDFHLTDHPTYYENYYYRTDTTVEYNTFKSFQGLGGLKGQVAGLTYRGYYKYRYMEYAQRYHDTIQSYTEHYLGGAIRYALQDSVYFMIEGERLLQQAGRMLVKVKVKGLSINAGYQSYLPTLVQQTYYGNNYAWKNNFSNTQHSHLRAEFSFKSKFVDLTPFVGVDHIARYVYFDSLSIARQDAGNSYVSHGGATVGFKWKGFRLRQTLRVNSVKGNEVVFTLPKLYSHSRVSHYSHVFKKAALLQLGVDLFYKSGYVAYSWSPGMMNYRLSNVNDSFSQLPAAWVANLFADLQIRQFNFFVRFSFLNEGFPTQGYFLTPYYPALPRSMEFGITWNFYD